MIKRRVIVSPVARHWFLKQVSYLLEVNPEAARNLVERFKQFQANLGQFSGMGVHGDIPGTRRVVMKPYVVTIRLRGGSIEIVAIRHGRQNDARAPSDAVRDDGD